MDKKAKKVTKKSSGTSKLIPVLIGLIVVLVGVILMYRNFSEMSQVSALDELQNTEVEHSDEYYEIMNLDFVNEYPTGYLEVVEANNRIVMYQYGTEIQDPEAVDIIKKQRQLLSAEILELNTLEHQSEGYLKEVRSFREKNRYITSRKTVSSSILAYEGDIAEVIVDEQYSDGLGVQYTYSLLTQNGQWKIGGIERKVTTSVAEPDFNKDSETETEEK